MTFHDQDKTDPSTNNHKFQEAIGESSSDSKDLLRAPKPQSAWQTKTAQGKSSLHRRRYESR
ncbi:MAG: hypothetical protein VKL42_21605 [Snowella sp.]|nr:hypothetical protein [Snowella sp.]